MRKYNFFIKSKISKKRLQYISDLHLEYHKKPKIKVSGEYLLLGGDISNPHLPNYKHFIKQSSQNYNKVFVIIGNHEYWYNDMETNNKKIKKITQQFDNVHLLDKKSYNLNKYQIIGTTLWSNIKKSKHIKKGDNYNISINDRKFTPEDTNHLHKDHVDWLQKEINKYYDKKLIVATHHLPSYKLILKQFSNYSDFYDRYANNLDYLIKPPIHAWICGHSHCTYQTKINDVNCCINAYNYRDRQNNVQFIDLI